MRSLVLSSRSSDVNHRSYAQPWRDSTFGDRELSPVLRPTRWNRSCRSVSLIQTLIADGFTDFNIRLRLTSSLVLRRPAVGGDNGEALQLRSPRRPHPELPCTQLGSLPTNLFWWCKSHSPLGEIYDNDI